MSSSSKWPYEISSSRPSLPFAADSLWLVLTGISNSLPAWPVNSAAYLDGDRALNDLPELPSVVVMLQAQPAACPDMDELDSARGVFIKLLEPAPRPLLHLFFLLLLPLPLLLLTILDFAKGNLPPHYILLPKKFARLHAEPPP